MNGTLYLVATPIGNLEDITLRGLRVLKEADLIACEDTRHTRKLLEHYGIDKPTISYHEHNEQDRSSELIERLQAGVTVALVTDAGTPLICDPGYRLVSRAVAAGIVVIAIPGASAILPALSASGLPTDSFYFGGFLPPKQSQRRRTLEEASEIQSSLVFYETPHRILEALQDIGEVLGQRSMVLARELTKLHEELLRGTPAELLEDLQSRPSIKGEMVLVIGKPLAVADDRPIPEAVEECMRQGMSRMDAMKAVAKRRGVSKREVYAVMEKAGPASFQK
jgi:16S rRNA (cytidine1402-2'-O)-methyltransferase